MERTTAVLRAVDGESHDSIAEQYRVTPQRVRWWIEQWTVRSGPWCGEALMPIERLAGCVLGDPVDVCTTRPDIVYRRAPTRVVPKNGGKGKIASAAAAAGRAWFLELLKRDPPDNLEQHERAWRALADEDRDALLAAWDMYQLAVQAMDDARRKVKRALELAAQEVAPENTTERAA